MSAIQQVSHSELIEEIEPFFAPMSADLVDSLIGQYNAARANVEALAAAVRAGQNASVLHCFVEGNVKEQRHSMPTTVESLFRVEGAIAQLNAELKTTVARIDQLRKEIDAIVAEIEGT